jgi:hypothetical protein
MAIQVRHANGFNWDHAIRTRNRDDPFVGDAHIPKNNPIFKIQVHQFNTSANSSSRSFKHHGDVRGNWPITEEMKEIEVREFAGQVRYSANSTRTAVPFVSPLPAGAALRAFLAVSAPIVTGVTGVSALEASATFPFVKAKNARDVHIVASLRRTGRAIRRAALLFNTKGTIKRIPTQVLVASSFRFTLISIGPFRLFRSSGRSFQPGCPFGTSWSHSV